MRKNVLKILLTTIVASGFLGGILGANLALLDPNQRPNIQAAVVSGSLTDMSSLVEQSSPAVVTVVSDLSSVEVDPENPGESGSTVGSGFVVSTDGQIVTSYHVVSEPDTQYYVITKDNQSFPIENIQKDKENDIAVLTVKNHSLPALNLGNSDIVKPGEPIIAIGNAFGSLQNTVTTGIISGVDRSIVARDQDTNKPRRFYELIQIDAAINPGNSGGPLMNLQGEVIGVNIAGSQVAQNIGFAIPINKVKELMENKPSGTQTGGNILDVFR